MLSLVKLIIVVLLKDKLKYKNKLIKIMHRLKLIP